MSYSDSGKIQRKSVLANFEKYGKGVPKKTPQQKAGKHGGHASALSKQLRKHGQSWKGC